MRASDVLLCTTPSMEGFRITRYWGMVRGVAVQSPTPSQGFDEPVLGGPSEAREEVTGQARLRATGQMREVALRAGATRCWAYATPSRRSRTTRCRCSAAAPR